jgi:CheY-like chemotaxis protein
MLARALERALGARRFSLHGAPARADIANSLLSGEYVIVDGDLPSIAERRAILSIGNGAHIDRACVDWRCGQKEAEREIFHRYAGRPTCLAEAELQRYLVDATVREPAQTDEAETVVSVGAEQPLDAQLEVVLAALPPPGERSIALEACRRVLVVEDDVEERLVLAEVLRELGWAVELAPDAAVALALLEAEGGFELVLTDHRMPGMTGVELARVITERHPTVRAVLLTAYGDEPTCHAAADAHAVTVLSKPVHILDLQRVLDEANV